jgi:flagellar FliL protein
MSKKMIIIIVAVVGLILMAAMVGFGVLLWSKVSTMGQPAEVAEPEEGAVEAEETSGTLHPLDTFIVNLADEDGKRYLRVTMNLELSKELLPEMIDAKLPQIRDRILMLLPSKTFADINSIDGKEILREELIEQINEVVPAGTVMNIYFTEFVIQ